MKRSYAFLFLLLPILFNNCCFSQIVFEKIFDIEGINEISEAAQLEDSSYMMVTPFELIYWSKYGNIQWRKDWDENFKAHRIYRGDPGYYLAGHSDGKICLAKYSESGEEIWLSKTEKPPYGSLSWDYFMMTTSNDQIILATKYFQDENDSLYVVKFSSDGRILWDLSMDLPLSYWHISDIGCISESTYGILTNYDYLTFIDSSGVFLDSIHFSGNLDDPVEFEPLSDSTMLLCFENRILSFNLNGNYDTILYQDSVEFVNLLYEYPYFYLRSSALSYGYSGNYFQKFGLNGSIQWSRKIGTSGNIHSMGYTNDKGFLFHGTSSNGTESMGYIVRTDSSGHVSNCKDSLLATQEKYLLCKGSSEEIKSMSIGSESVAYWTYNGDTVHVGNDPFIFYGNYAGDYTHILRSCEDSLVVPILVYDTVNPNFTYVLKSDGVQYLQEPLDDGWKWRWTIGDGELIVDSLNPFYQYNSNGNYFTNLEILFPCESDCTKRVLYHIGLNELAEKDFHVFPNPVMDNITLQLPENKRYQVQVYNLSGILLKTIEDCINEMTISLDNFLPGIYLVRFITDDNIKSLKIIKQ